MAKKTPTPKSLTGISNIDFWNMARAKNPQFASHTAKGTSDLFSEKGFEALTRNDIGAINEFFEISLRVAFQKIDISNARNPLAEVGLVEVYDTPNGGFTQRIAINSIKPVTPAFKGLENYASVDPFVVRKPTDSERFFGQNFDYQSFITIQDFQVKTIFLSEYGMGEFISGILQGLANGYVLQEYVNTKEAINTAINSTTYALKDTQKLAVGSWTSDSSPADADLKSLILTLKDLATGMRTQAQTGMYNANGFETYVDPSDYVVLMRAGVKNRIQLQLEIGAFNPETLTIPFDVTEVADFGGLVPYVLDGATHVPVQPIYDKNGEQVAYVDASVTVNGYATFNGSKWVVNVTSGGTTADTNQTVTENELDGWDDPNEEVIAVVAQKGLIFENKQNPYTVTPIYNPRGLYTNYWASSANNSINVDPNYNMIIVVKPSS